MGKAAASNLEGQNFGELTVIKRTDERKRGNIVWECQCSCGRIHYALTSDLKRGSVTSCGCNHDSKGIRLIKKILNENNIKYITEKTFSTCKFLDTTAYARFDFYLIDKNILIEYDGEQHFKEKDLNFFRDSLEKRQQHDLFKNQWCKENKIPLIRISYADLDNINSINDLFLEKYFIK